MFFFSYIQLLSYFLSKKSLNFSIIFLIVVNGGLNFAGILRLHDIKHGHEKYKV